MKAAVGAQSTGQAAKSFLHAQCSCDVLWPSCFTAALAVTWPKMVQLCLQREIILCRVEVWFILPSLALLTV